MTDNSLLAAALDDARRGIPVFPCHPADKRPLTRNGFKDATTDEQQIRAWWQQWPDALIGMRRRARCPRAPASAAANRGRKHDTADNPKGFNAAVLAIIDFLGGDRRTGMCRCPIHDDSNPSLSVSNGDKVRVVLHCFGCKRDPEIIDYLRRNNAWPSSEHFSTEQAAATNDEKRAPDERRQYALNIYNAVKNSYGPRLGKLLLLKHYFEPRGLAEVPSTAMIIMPWWWVRGTGASRDETLPSPNVGMLLPIVDKSGRFQGMHVTWLNDTLSDKREEEPQRQTYGLLKGNFVELDQLDYQHPLDKLIIAEGIETAQAARQLTALLGERLFAIAAGGSNLANVNPPEAKEYIICVDADDNDAGLKRAGMLAQCLVGHVVRIAMPDRPEGGKSGYDWNDALLDAQGDEAKLKELARAIEEAPTFDQVMTKEEKREVRLNALAVLKLEDPLAYEAEREAAGRDLKTRRSVLDDEVERRCKLLKEQRERERTKPTPVNMELLEASAREIIECDDVLELFARDCARTIAGEKVNLKMLMVVGTSRLFEHKAAMNAALKGPSAGGKSEVREAVVKFFPPEDVVAFTSLSPSALLYHEEDYAHKILSMGEAQDREEIKFQDALLRQLMSEGKLRHLVVQKVGNKLVSVTVEKNGPCAFMVTTTKNKLHPENETRLNSLEIDDSQAQTAKVIEKVALNEGLNLGAVESGFYKRWHDHQRWLKAGETRVQVPFSVALSHLVGSTKLARSVRLRRDFGQLVRAIKVHALLHRAQRKRNEDGEIVAEIHRDYGSIRTLMKDLLSTAAEMKVRQQTLDTVEAVQQVCARNAGDGEATVRQVAELLNLDRSTTRRRLYAAEDLELVVNVEKREQHENQPNQPRRMGRYRPTGQRLEAVAELLPTPDVLKQTYQEERRERQRTQAQSLSPEYPRNRVHRRTGGAN